VASEILGLIPARGGSKNVPHKNIVSLAGKPLLAYTCEAARASRHQMRLVINTDDEAIAAVGRQYGAESPFLRPAKLARDETPIVDVLIHSLVWFRENEDYRPEIIVLLQPTSPLRRPEHIDAALDLLVDSDADTVVSVTQIPHQFSPHSAMRLERGQLIPYVDEPMILRRQDKPRFYARNGPAVLVVRREVVECGRLYGDVVRPLKMSATDSIDIDDVDDLALAEFWLTRRHSQKTTR
jgi:N-acylneuraminate cytidylyltransferase/CMP-N,N'-diacetyllegionaminic acid synthase